MERRDTELIAAFARVLRRARKRTGLSQEELAFRTGLSVSYISRLETRNRQPTLTAMSVLCDHLSQTVVEMMAEIDEERGAPDG